MKEIRKDATVHPATVTAFSQQPSRRRRRSPQGATPRASGVHTTQPHPLAWAIALDALDGGDLRRLETLPDGGVYIHNSPDWRKR